MNIRPDIMACRICKSRPGDPCRQATGNARELAPDEYHHARVDDAHRASKLIGAQTIGSRA